MCERIGDPYWINGRNYPDPDEARCQAYPCDALLEEKPGDRWACTNPDCPMHAEDEWIPGAELDEYLRGLRGRY